MVDTTTSLEHKLQPERVGRFDGDNNVDFTEQATAGNPVRAHRPSPWPFKAESTSPLMWWRQLPPDALYHAERSLLVATLESISLLHGGDDVQAAMHGDAAAAIDAALELMPIEEITLRVDVTLTALLRIALAGDAAAALVMAQIVGLTDIGHEFTTELAVSWLNHGERHSDEPHKFNDARVVLLTAFEERRKGEDA
jgi:hypothetical protein